MRVISGTAKGRTLKPVPGMGTRPTTDKVKEALFSMIGPYFEGGRALDLFAGTGGLGIEALSRGAEWAVFIDKDMRAIEVVRGNLTATGLAGKAEVYRNDARRALKALAKRNLSFHYVFLDPPYRLKDADELLMEMWDNGLLRKDAIIVVEHDASHSYSERIGPLSIWKKADYGDIAVSIYLVDAEASAE
ncbi:DNA methyltransferase [Paenibacillus dendritiformis]|uniref:16S rRNA (guanine(966)-N(2))-methyltransferase RsmD n=1 Tax=Paenibacillus dendritiformis TaxID=130049 RepID=UPI0018CFACA4|nr:16S rRNA (guanine(966)-N(2))-methyltransferase RsmD [Paenibacillus dendritiformis]MBG9793417.1 DNA methyltransferase [Paenibacillus dendritiformis]